MINPNAHVIVEHITGPLAHDSQRFVVVINGMHHTCYTLAGALNLLGNPDPRYYRVERV